LSLLVGSFVGGWVDAPPPYGIGTFFVGNHLKPAPTDLPLIPIP
jgi:hypothetical protein